MILSINEMTMNTGMMPIMTPKRGVMSIVPVVVVCAYAGFPNMKIDANRPAKAKTPMRAHFRVCFAFPSRLMENIDSEILTRSFKLSIKYTV